MRDYNGPIPTPPQPSSRPADTKKWVELTDEQPCPKCGEPLIALLVTQHAIDGTPRHQIANSQCRNACGSVI